MSDTIDYNLLRRMLRQQSLDNLDDRETAIELMELCQEFMEDMNECEPGIQALNFRLVKLLQVPELVVQVQTSEGEWFSHEELKGDDEELAADLLVDLNSTIGTISPQRRDFILQTAFMVINEDRNDRRTCYQHDDKSLAQATGKILGPIGIAKWEAEMQRRALDQNTATSTVEERNKPRL